MGQGPPQVSRAAMAGHWIARAVLALALGFRPGAQTSAAESVFAMSGPISTQPLAAALNEFAHQSRLQLVDVSTIVPSRTSFDKTQKKQSVVPES